jgi:hypothetical protein
MFFMHIIDVNWLKRAFNKDGTFILRINNNHILLNYFIVLYFLNLHIFIEY